MRNAANLMRICVTKAYTPVLKVKLYAVAILPRLSADSLYLAVERNASNPPQSLAENSLLLFQLVTIVGMLILAAAAPAEILAPRHNPMNGRLQHFYGARTQQIALGSPRLDQHLLARQCERHQHDVAAQPRKRIASVNKLLHLNGGLLFCCFDRSITYHKSSLT